MKVDHREVMTRSLSSSCFLFFAGICGCRQSHSNTQTHTHTHTHTHHPAGLRLNLQDSRSAETHTTSCSEDWRSQTAVSATLHHSKVSGETSEYFLLTHLNSNSFTFISVHLTRRTCWFRGPFCAQSPDFIARRGCASHSALPG